MPTVAMVDGVKVIFYRNDHLPPHFHAAFAEHQALISLESLDVLEGALPKAKLKGVLDWAASHREELQACWNKVQNNEHPGKVE